jgi:hypothetical protein
LALQIQPLRIDWQLAPTQQQLFEVGGMPTVGPFPDTLRAFEPAMRSWLERVDHIQRLAFGAVLVHRLASPEDKHAPGFDVLSPYLPFGLDAAGSEDFM